MNESDLRRIERELEIELPPSYRARMRWFPVPALAGNTETELWDDAEKLIALNRALRRGRTAAPWPPHFFSIGRTDGGLSAIDLRTPDAPVWWMARPEQGPGAGRSGQGFEPWVRDYVEDWRDDLLMGAIDPDGTPEARRAREARNAARVDWVRMLTTTAAGFALAYLFVMLKLWLTG
jgi:hypothetical protein